MTIGLTIYFLMWPVIVAVLMFFIARGFFRDWKEARDQGLPMI